MTAPATEAVNSEKSPSQMVSSVASALAGSAGVPSTVTESQLALSQPEPASRARAKYVVVDAGLTLRRLPVPTRVPPQLAVYQSISAPPDEALRSEDSPLQIEAGVASASAGSAVLAHLEL